MSTNDSQDFWNAEREQALEELLLREQWLVIPHTSHKTRHFLDDAKENALVRWLENRRES